MSELHTATAFNFDKTFMQIKDGIPTLIKSNPVIVNGLECVNSQGGVGIICDVDGVFAVELEYDFDFDFTGDYETCLTKFLELANQ